MVILNKLVVVVVVILRSKNKEENLWFIKDGPLQAGVIQL